MNSHEPCPFCGGEETTVVWLTNRKSKEAYVRCDHCSARGSSQAAWPMRDGTYDESKEELIGSAIAAWNGEHTKRKKEPNT